MVLLISINNYVTLICCFQCRNKMSDQFEAMFSYCVVIVVQGIINCERIL